MFESYGSRWNRELWSLRIGQIAGINIHIHLSLILLVALLLLLGLTRGSFTSFAMMTVTIVILFVSVLLHELGHCFGARSVGGEAGNVLLWPLGGLAFSYYPQRPGAFLTTVAAGPFVNLLLVLLILPPLFLVAPFTWNWFNIFDLGSIYTDGGITLRFTLELMMRLNFILLVFNLIPILPLDGGGILQGILWHQMPAARARRYTLLVGCWTAGILALIAAWARETFALVLLLFFAAYCYQGYRNAELLGELEENEFGYDFSQGYTSLEHSSRSAYPSQLISPWQAFRQWYHRRRQQRQREQAAKIEIELDRILAKISAEGMDSLTRSERKTLEAASAQRKKTSQT